MNIESYRQMLSRYMEPDIVERTMGALNPQTNGLNQEDAIGGKAKEKPSIEFSVINASTLTLASQIAQAHASRGEKVRIEATKGKMMVKKIV